MFQYVSIPANETYQVHAGVEGKVIRLTRLIVRSGHSVTVKSGTTTILPEIVASDKYVDVRFGDKEEKPTTATGEALNITNNIELGASCVWVAYEVVPR